MQETGDEMVYRMHREVAEGFRDQPLPEIERRTISYTELPEAKPDDVLYCEWNLYRREVGQWLAQGHEGQWVLIEGETVVGMYGSWDEARTEGLGRYLLNPFLVQQILAEEPVYRIRGYS